MDEFFDRNAGGKRFVCMRSVSTHPPLQTNVLDTNSETTRQDDISKDERSFKSPTIMDARRKGKLTVTDTTQTNWTTYRTV